MIFSIKVFCIDAYCIIPRAGTRLGPSQLQVELQARPKIVQARFGPKYKAHLSFGPESGISLDQPGTDPGPRLNFSPIISVANSHA